METFDYTSFIEQINKKSEKVADLNGIYLISIDIANVEHKLYVPVNKCYGNTQQHLPDFFFDEYEYSVCGKVLVPAGIVILSNLTYIPYKPQLEKILCLSRNVKNK